MSTPTRSRFRVGLPELISVLALVGIAWWLWPSIEPEPTPDRQCATPNAEFDCFLQVPGGTFWMGAQSTDRSAPGFDPDAEANEGPVHQVTVSPFWMLRFETSVGLYRRCVAAGKCTLDDLETGGGFSTYTEAQAEGTDAHSDRLPINSVSWQGAQRACAFLGGHLPTEAQWEWAARGPKAWRWAWGDQKACAIPPADLGFARLDMASITECTQDGPVYGDALPERGVFGTTGMSGNLWEWTSDWYAADAYGGHAAVDPLGPTDGTTRAQRGGSWMATTPQELRAAVRGGLDPEAKLNDVGFRCVFGDPP
ncbi:MAG: formylglycine-generating enzyme family protein [Alphaproteobacteria bacterium]|nr:formylglycine-generating enzyme family protein [Alphaproteobacteria bacterium]